MRFFSLLPLAFSAPALALPTANSPIEQRTPAALERRETTLETATASLDAISQNLNSEVTDVVAALGLGDVQADIDDLLKGLVGDVDGLLNEVVGGVDGLLEGLGLGAVVTTVEDVETALGLSGTDTIGTLLTDLGVLPA